MALVMALVMAQTAGIHTAAVLAADCPERAIPWFRRYPAKARDFFNFYL